MCIELPGGDTLERRRRMRVERSITIGRPVEQVFGFVSTPKNDPQWVSASVWHEQTSSGPIGVGTTTEEDVRFLGRRMRYTWEVTAYESPHAFAIRSLSGVLPSTIQVRLEPVGDTTRLTVAIETELVGASRLAGSLMKVMIGRQIERQLRTLQGLLEHR